MRNIELVEIIERIRIEVDYKRRNDGALAVTVPRPVLHPHLVRST